MNTNNYNSKQIYEAIKPTRLGTNALEGDNWLEKWANYSPKSCVMTFLMGYVVLLGLVCGWCVSTGFK